MTFQFIRRVVVGVVGGTVLLAGLAMIVLPGPAFVVIPAALAILATEFVWARRCLRRAKEMIGHAARGRGSGPVPGPSAGSTNSKRSSPGDDPNRGAA